MVRKIGLYRDPRNKNKPWVVRWYGEYDPTTEKQRRYTKSFKLKVEAEQFVAKQAVAFGEGQLRDKPERISLKEFLRDWLKTKRPDYQPETVKLYDNAIERILGYFGQHTELSRITHRSAAKFIAELDRKDGRDGELSGWSRARTLRNAKTIFGTAVDWGLIAENPFGRIKRPKLTAKRWHYLTPDEFAALSAVAPLRQKTIYSLAYCCGLRLGEFLSLTWSDIDFEASEVTIQNRPAAAKRPPFFIKDTESRTVPVPQYCIDVLDDLKTYNDATDQTPYIALDERQYRTMLDKWKKYREAKRPWANRDMQNNTLQTFKRRIRQAGIQPSGTLSLHTLRKCCIQNWADNISNPEVVRVLAGHSDLKTTMEFYSQITKDQSEKAAAAIDNLLRR